MTPAIRRAAIAGAFTVVVFLVALAVAPGETVAVVHAVTSGLGHLAYDVTHGVATLLRTWGAPDR